MCKGPILYDIPEEEYKTQQETVHNLIIWEQGYILTPGTMGEVLQLELHCTAVCPINFFSLAKMQLALVNEDNPKEK